MNVDTIICPVCSGTGKEICKHIDHATGKIIKEQMSCALCKGTGHYIVSSNCRLYRRDIYKGYFKNNGDNT